MNTSVSDCYQTKIWCQDDLQSTHRGGDGDDEVDANWQYSLWSKLKDFQMSSIWITLWPEQSNEWEKRIKI